MRGNKGKKLRIKITRNQEINASYGEDIKEVDDLKKFIVQNKDDEKFYCSLCKSSSHKRMWIIRVHIEAVHFPKIFVYHCDECDETFHSRIQHKSHKISKHGLKASVSTRGTNRKLRYRKLRLMDTKVTRNPDAYKEYEAEIKEPKDMKKFIKKNEKDEQFFCSLCRKIISNPRYHMEGIHFPNLFIYHCDQCERTFPTQRKYAFHKRAHDANNSGETRKVRKVRKDKKIRKKRIQIKVTRNQNTNEAYGEDIQEPDDLKKFITKDEADQKFYCSMCKHSHKSIWTIRTHIEAVHFPKIFFYHCDECEETFHSWIRHKIHKNSKHGLNKSANAKSPPRKLRSEKIKMVNMKVTRNPDTYKEYEAEIREPRDMMKFIKKNEKEQLYCTLCSKNTSNPKYHMEGAHFPNLFTYHCNQCELIFPTRRKYIDHKRTHHVGSNNASESKKQIKTVKIKDMEIFIKSKLKEENKADVASDPLELYTEKEIESKMNAGFKENSKKNDKCKYCDYTSKWAANVRLHQRRHQKDLNNFCKSILQEILLNIDKFTTSKRQEEELYKCEFCPMIFKDNSDVERHMLNHALPCKLCGAIFKSKDQLKFHRRKHTESTLADIQASMIMASSSLEVSDSSPHADLNLFNIETISPLVKTAAVKVHSGLENIFAISQNISNVLMDHNYSKSYSKQMVGKVQESVPEDTRIQESVPEYSKIQESAPEFTKIQESVPEFTRIQESVPECVIIEDSIPTNIQESVPECVIIEDSIPEYEKNQESTTEHAKKQELAPDHVTIKGSIPDVEVIQESVPEQSTPEYTETQESTPEHITIQGSVPDNEIIVESVPEYAEIKELTAEDAKLPDSVPAYSKTLRRSLRIKNSINVSDCATTQKSLPVNAKVQESTFEYKQIQESVNECSTVKQSVPETEINQESNPECAIIQKLDSECETILESQPKGATIQESDSKSAMIKEPDPEGAVIQEADPEDAIIQVTDPECAIIQESINKKPITKPSKAENQTHGCQICPRTFNNKSNMKKHMQRIHTTEKSFVCNVCKKSFKRKDILENHSKIHDNFIENPERAQQFMSLIFKSKTTPRKEVQPEEKKKILKTYPPSKKKEAKSKISEEYGIKTEDHIDKTLKTNDRVEIPVENLFKCEKCEAVFKNNSNKVRHMLIHTGEKPFNCKICGKTFTRRDKMKLHLIKHGKSPDEKDACDATQSLKTKNAADPIKHGKSPTSKDACDGTPSLKNKNAADPTQCSTLTRSELKTRTATWTPNEMMNPNYLYKFVRKDPSGQKFNCTICSYSHKEIGSTRNHVGSAHFPPLLTYHCDQCDHKFATKNEYVKHKSNKHNRVLLVF